MVMHRPGSQRIEFPGALGEPLAAAIDWPRGRTQAFAIFAHCFTCSKNFLASRRISQALTAHGFAVLRFDFTGLGSSEGEFGNTNFSSNAADVIAAAEWLETNHQAPSLLVGHSFGGSAVLSAGARIASIQAVATIAAPASVDHVLRVFKHGVETIRARGEAVVDIGGRPFTIKRQFLDDLRGTELTDQIANLHAALLVMHAPADHQVGIENAETIYKAARHPKSFVSLDGADHLLSQPADSIYVAEVISAWASRYVSRGKEQLRDEGHVTAAESGEGAYHLEINASGHALSADEPTDVGGTNRGATPYDLLSAALGACTTITLRMYANRKKLDVTHIETRVSHSKRHADDSQYVADERAAKVDHFEREIFITGHLDAAQLQRMLEIADLCPVHKTLEHSSKVVSRLGNPTKESGDSSVTAPA